MPDKMRQLPIQLPIPTLHKLIDLQRVRGPSISAETFARDPVKKSMVPSMAAVIRSLIEEAHKREFDRG